MKPIRITMLTVIIVLLVTPACRSSRAVVSEESHAETASASISSGERVVHDTLIVKELVERVRRDTIRMESHDGGTVEISRDSAGGPVRISWSRRRSSIREGLLKETVMDSVGAAESENSAEALQSGYIVAKKDKSSSERKDISAPWDGGHLIVPVLLLLILTSWALMQKGGPR